MSNVATTTASAVTHGGPSPLPNNLEAREPESGNLALAEHDGQDALARDSQVSEPFPPLPTRPAMQNKTGATKKTKSAAASRTKQRAKGRAATRRGALNTLGVGPPPPARPESPGSPSPAPVRVTSDARKRRRAEKDVDGPDASGAVAQMVFTQPAPGDITANAREAEELRTNTVRDATGNDRLEGSDVDMDVALPEGDDVDLDTYRLMSFHGINPYDIRQSHLPPPVAPSPTPTANLGDNAYDPSRIREQRSPGGTLRIAPPHLVRAYRTEVDEHGHVRPSNPGPPTRRPNSQPFQSGEFGDGSSFDERAFRAATFHAPPYQLRTGPTASGVQQGHQESPAAYLTRATVPPGANAPPPHLAPWPTARPSAAPLPAQDAEGSPTRRDTSRIHLPPPPSRAPSPGRQQRHDDGLHLPPRAPPSYPTSRAQDAWRVATTTSTGPTMGPMTPVPRGGWRMVQGDSPMWKFVNQDTEQVSAWLRDDAPSCLAHIPGLGATDDGRWVRRGEMELTLRRFFNTDTISVTLPTPANPQPARNSHPYFCLVRAEDPDVVATLLRHVWMSMSHITMGFLRLDLDPPTLVASFQDIHAFVATTEDGIADLVVDALLTMSDIVISLIIDDLANDGRWQSFSALEAFDTLLHSVRVRLVPRRIRGDIVDPIALVYCQSPTADAGGWEAFRHHLQHYQFGSAHSGRPRPCTTALWCALCHSHDHPTGLCYLPDVPMWHGPSIADAIASQAPQRQTRTRGNGRVPARGRGAGRGRGGR